LKGESTVLVWGRDVRNTWQSELEQEQPPERIEAMRLDLRQLLGDRVPAVARAYDPWANEWTELEAGTTTPILPAFARSILLRIELSN
jgi:hypothetical protein